jgi:hypothetical protein
VSAYQIDVGVCAVCQGTCIDEDRIGYHPCDACGGDGRELVWSDRPDDDPPDDDW